MPNHSFYLEPDIGKELDRYIDEQQNTSKTALVASLVEDFVINTYFRDLVKQRDEIQFFAAQMRAGFIPQRLQNIFRRFNADNEKGRMRVMNALIKHHNELDNIIDELNSISVLNKKEQEARKPPVQDILNMLDDDI